MKTVFLFDWGNTIMKDYDGKPGPMSAWDKVEMMPFADTMLKELSQKADCFLATNAKESGKDEIIKALKRVGLDIYFKNVFCFRELGVTKPSNAYFELIVAMLGTDKESIVMVGDSIETDILGAQEYGIDAVLYDPENAYPDYHGLKITNLPELLYIF